MADPDGAVHAAAFTAGAGQRRPVGYDVWVTFNDITPDGTTSALRRHATPGAPFPIGADVVAGDDEGHRCPARVIAPAGVGRIHLRVNLAALTGPDRTDISGPTDRPEMTARKQAGTN